ncbi:MAG TPA: ABC transporter ATP-binding protein [Acidimicrobiales bacterium]
MTADARTAARTAPEATPLPAPVRGALPSPDAEAEAGATAEGVPSTPRAAGTVSAPPAIEAVGIRKAFGSSVAVASASVTVAPGQLVALLGPSGSGKTTLLRVIAGLEAPDEGTVAINGRPVVGPGTWVEPERRRVGMVFQDGALFPHLTVAKNLAFGEPAPGRVEECLALVGLADRADAYPHELSGGERQRVALARALAPEPDVVLLDEPFASLDASLRTTLREDVAAILRQAGASALLVTHDQQEALSLADVVVVMRDGVVEQTGTPADVYATPATRWVAEFLGAADVLPGEVAGDAVVCELGRFPGRAGLAGEVEVVVRPESVVLHPADAGLPDAAVPGRVVGRSFYGHDQLVHVELASGRRVQSRCLGHRTWAVGQDVGLVVDGPVSVLAPDATPEPAAAASAG